MRANHLMAFVACVGVAVAGCSRQESRPEDQAAEKVFAQGKEIYLYDVTWQQSQEAISGTVKYRIRWPEEADYRHRGSIIFTLRDRQTGQYAGNAYADNTAVDQLPYDKKEGSEGVISWSCPLPQPQRRSPGVEIVLAVSARYLSVSEQAEVEFDSNEVSFPADQASGPAAEREASGERQNAQQA